MADTGTGEVTYEASVDEDGYIDGLIVTDKEGAEKAYLFRPENYDEVEAARKAAEAAAGQATSARKAVMANESERESAEAGRAEAEEGRKSAETERETAEKGRESAERQRESDFEERAQECRDAASLANTAAGNADSATASAESAARKAEAAAAAVSVATLGISPAQLSATVRMGRAADVLRIGDQVNSVFTWEGREHPIAYDVGQHMDGRDDDHPLVTLADGSQVPALFLIAHNALPMACPYDAKEALYSPESDLAPGTYSFDVEVNYTWGTGVAGAKGTATYSFTSAEEWPAGCQAVWDASYSAKPSTLTVYDAFTSDVIETVKVTAAAAGTSLGKVSETVNGRFNTIQRACEGSNDYGTSGLRAWLTSEGTQWNSQMTIWDRPHPLAGKPGFLSCIPDDLRAVLGAISVKTQRHQVDGGDVFEGFDRAFILSARQHYFANYLGATSEGYADEGVPLDYCKAIAAAAGRSAPYPGWATYPELITYDLANPTVAVYRWVRSEYRNAAYSYYAGYVNSGGGVSGTGCASGNRVVPSLPIV